MGERKVLNKYYPPDFDPGKVPRNRRPKDELEQVRFMLPMTIRCGTCGDFMYTGTKFNTRKETVQSEDYLGVKIFRFYLKCTACSAPFTIKTDPENASYTCEKGATRNYEPWREAARAQTVANAAADAKKDGGEEDEEEDTGVDAMTALENKTMDAREEMEALDALDELKTLRTQQARLSTASLLKATRTVHSKEDQDAEESHDELARAAFAEKRRKVAITTAVRAPPQSISNLAVKGEVSAVKPLSAMVRISVKRPQALSVLDGLASAYPESDGDSSGGEATK